ncbi:MAG: transglutaminase domain-containing protein [Candidatus Delongbacteria bacterium]|nr:transglutaminase domain-containing protein [Candidatus Delongbacteria bacterium]
MKDFPLISSAALIYWGYISGNITLSLIFAFALESHRFIKTRLDFKDKDFNYISMITTLSLIGYVIFYINSPKELGIFTSLTRFLPIALFPLVFFYNFSTSKYVNAKNLFLLFVVNKYSVTHPFIRKFRPDLLYFAVLILASGVNADLTGFVILFILTSVVLFKFRPKNHSVSRFFSALMAVFLLSVIFQAAIFNSISLLKDFLTDLYLERFLSDRNKSVRLGNIADLKNNFRIELRAEVFGKRPFALYLRDRVYNSYHKGGWMERGVKDGSLSSELIDYESGGLDSLRVFFFSKGRNDQLKIPFSAFDFSGIETAKAGLNHLGTVSLTYTQYLIDYKAYSYNDSRENLIGGPDEQDSVFIGTDSVYTDNLIDRLGLNELGHREIFFRLKEYFATEYNYSLDYIDWPQNEVLGTFLETKRGHCELFASLSALVYRRLGYPSRYVTGYFLSEYSDFEDKFIGRRKDRHAWIIVWDETESVWKEYDTTPPDITGYRTDPSFFEKIYDMFSFVFYRFFMFRKENENLFQNLLLYSLIPLGLFLFYRILKDVKKERKDVLENRINPYKKLPELEKIESKLRSEEFEPENETVSKWFDRIKLLISDKSGLDHLRSSYYRKRYKNIELSEIEKKEFEEKILRLKRKETKDT